MKRVLVIGDFIHDRYEHHTAVRLCPEGPVPVLHKTKTPYETEGGAALVAKQLMEFGASFWVEELYTSRSTKTRIFADDRLLARVDEDSWYTIRPEGVIAALNNDLQQGIDAIIVSDYGKGGMTEGVATEICSRAALARIPLFVDAKQNWDWYAGAFAAFPNEKELSHTAFRDHNFVNIIAKLGPNGCQVNGTPVPTFRAAVRDVTGAGDVFLAGFVMNYLDTKNLITAAKFANHLAGISVQHVGTYVVSPRDLWEKKSAA